METLKFLFDGQSDFQPRFPLRSAFGKYNTLAMFLQTFNQKLQHAPTYVVYNSGQFYLVATVLA